MSQVEANQVAKVEVGKQYHYRLKATGRSRPSVGEVVKRMGIFTVVRNLRTGDEVRVKSELIGKEYSFKPYKKKVAEVVEQPAAEPVVEAATETE